MEEVSRSWVWSLFFGILTLVIGILVMAWPEETLKVLAVLFGLQLFVMGIYALAISFAAGQEHRVWTVFLGIFSIIVAIIVIRNVTQTVVVLAVIIGIYWVIHGILRLIMAISDRAYPQRGFTIFLALLSILAGIVVLAWPLESVTVLAWLVGVWFVVLGALGIVLAFLTRREAPPARRA